MSAGKLLTEQLNKMPGLSLHCIGLASHSEEEALLQIASFYENLELLRLWFDPGAPFFFSSFYLFGYSDHRSRLKKEVAWVQSSQT